MSRPRMYAIGMLLATSGLFVLAMSWDIQRTVRAAGGTAFIVTNTADSGAGSLRQAITDANANPGLDTISFSIGSGPQTITPLQRLPTLTDEVVIDGTTQPGFSGSPIVELRGTVQPDGNGLFITGGNSTVRGLVLNDFNTAILISTNGGNRVEGCYIGTDMTGTVALSNFNGISISVSNNVIGGTTADKRNVISGSFGGAGIDISRFCCTGDLSPIVGNVIQGNYIGLNATGSGGIPNERQGIRISSLNSNVDVTGNIVGGTQPGAGNVISGNDFDGILLEGTKVKNNSVQGNFIGTDATGSFAIPNKGNGVSVSGDDNLIGGTVPGARNVISGNGGGSGGSGVGLGTTGSGTGQGNVVQGNVIGANAALTTPLPNVGYGVVVGGTNSIVGGLAAGEANTIAFNGFDGIGSATTSATSNSFRGNSIFSNGFHNHPSGATIGIDLGGFGVTPNDPGDGDTGANNLQNFPVITSVNVSPTSVNVKGTLNSAINQTFNLDFYANSVCDASGFGEGARRIGSAPVTTDSGGNATFDITFMLSLPANQVLTATATDPGGNTSEFSQCSPGSSAVGSVSFDPASVMVSESSGFASFVLSRTGGTAGSLTVGFAVTGVTALAGSDFTATTGTVTFADGEASRMFSVPILDDTVNEVSFETAKVTLSTSGDLDTLGSLSTATLSISDDDSPSSLSVGDVSTGEGDSGTTDFNFPVTLSAASGNTVTLTFATVAGTAIGGGNDYLQPVMNSITIPPGQTNAVITIKVVGDTITEPNETFFLNIGNPMNATISDNQGLATIIDDESSSDPPTLQFGTPRPSVSEGSNSVLLEVTRSGDLAAPATVQYGPAGPSSASDRSDYNAAFGTLSFAAGESSKTFRVFITDDVFVEGSENFLVRLSSPTGGANLGDPATSVVQIIDNDTSSPSSNPIDAATFFVRQHYVDFLNREPDAAGLAFWTNQITECQQPGATCSAEVRRINVSAAFFLSIEFQETGFLVYRIYKAAYANMPGAPVPLRLNEFLPDTQQIGKDVIIGQPGAEQQLENNKVAFALDFVSRARFISAYATTMTPAQFVDALFANAGVTPSAADRDAAINEFGGAGNTIDVAARARALRRVAENSTLAQQEKNNAFVLMQYLGYLRRNPNDAPEPGLNFDGYNFWLNKLNQFNGNFINAEMVKAFIISAEYRQRFGP